MTQSMIKQRWLDAESDGEDINVLASLIPEIEQEFFQQMERKGKSSRADQVMRDLQEECVPFDYFCALLDLLRDIDLKP